MFKDQLSHFSICLCLFLLALFNSFSLKIHTLILKTFRWSLGISHSNSISNRICEQYLAYQKANLSQIKTDIWKLNFCINMLLILKKFLRKMHNIFHGGRTSLHFFQHGIGFPFSAFLSWLFKKSPSELVCGDISLFECISLIISHIEYLFMYLLIILMEEIFIHCDMWRSSWIIHDLSWTFCQVEQSVLWPVKHPSVLTK